MLQWITFMLALFGAVLWAVVLTFGTIIYRGNRAQVRAMRSMASAMRAGAAMAPRAAPATVYRSGDLAATQGPPDTA